MPTSYLQLEEKINLLKSRLKANDDEIQRLNDLYILKSAEVNIANDRIAELKQHAYDIEAEVKSTEPDLDRIKQIAHNINED